MKQAKSNKGQNRLTLKYDLYFVTWYDRNYDKWTIIRPTCAFVFVNKAVLQVIVAQQLMYLL